jgi:hypothetical protein
LRAFPGVEARPVTAGLSGLAHFKAIVLTDATLQSELRRAPDLEGFMALVVARAAEHGLAIERGELDAALAAGAHAWRLRWIER